MQGKYNKVIEGFVDLCEANGLDDEQMIKVIFVGKKQ